ncbi:unnamed protein product [Mytilus coruscus]|uniref:Uncharacterized protein n=1 Tax=Mytilus coruscus TaxID=42192 RepID=A0A6J8BNT3_MYTCO|nr:unnamed protein product [Mytilus coruscus]
MMLMCTVITVVGVLITIVIAVIVILIFHRRKRKRTEFNSRKSVITTNCYDMSWSGEGEQTMQMLSNNNRSNNRTNAVPFILQQTQRPGNISFSNYQDPVDMDNQYKRLDFTMQNDVQKSLKEVHNDYSLHYYKRTSSPAVNDDGSNISKKQTFRVEERFERST